MQVVTLAALAGPIAVLRASLDWLDDALPSGRLADGDGEARDVVSDGRAAVEALVRTVQELRRGPDRAEEAPALGGLPGERPPRRATTGE